MALVSKIVLNITSELTNAQDLTTSAAPHAIKRTISLATGVVADTADLIFSDQRTLGAGLNEDLDLAGVLLDPFGLALTFVKVKMLYVFAAATNGAYIQVGGAVATQFVNWVADASDKVNVSAGGVLLLAAPNLAGYAVGAGASDFLRITNSDGGAGATYDIVIIGTSS